MGDPAGEDADGTPGGSNPGPLDEKVTRVVARSATGETPSGARARVREVARLVVDGQGDRARAIERAAKKKTRNALSRTDAYVGEG